MKTINFYKVAAPYGFLSNFARFSINIDGLTYRTSEHYFQAEKFAGSDYAEQVRNAKTPSDAAKLGRSRDYPLREDWEEVKEDIMRRALRAKFAQHGTLRDKLLETGDALLVEHTTNDSYWGDGGDGSGKNRLGILLMELRSELSGKSMYIRGRSHLNV